MAKIEEPKRKAAIKDYYDKYPPEIRPSWRSPKEQRTPYERMMAARAGQYLDPSSWAFVGRPEKILESMPAPQKQRWYELKARLDQISAECTRRVADDAEHGRPRPRRPADLPAAPRQLRRPREPVEPGFLSVLDPSPAKVVPTSAGVTAAADGPAPGAGECSRTRRIR